MKKISSEKFNLIVLNRSLGGDKNKNKKFVAYPQEDFLFTILHEDSGRPPKKYI
jgi:hypothetical protein